MKLSVSEKSEEVIFTDDQIEKLKVWKNSLQSEGALAWKIEEDKAEEQIHILLESKDFQKEGLLTSDEFDQMFRLMKNFSGNRALSNLLYRDNGLEEFNQKLKNLFYGKERFAKRVDAFFKLKGIGTQTLSQFLLALDTKKYPLMTSQTRDSLELDAQQEQKAMKIALAHFQITNPDQFLERTIRYLRTFVIFDQIKTLLNLEKFTSVNNLIWFATKEPEAPEEAFKSFASVSLEKDLRDYLAKYPKSLEKGLKLIQKEFPTKEVGNIDLLLTDKKGYEVVVELKKGRNSDDVVGQLSRYMGWVMENRNKKVRGIIVVGEPDERLKYSILPFRGNVKIKYYKVKFEVTDNYQNSES